jgi:hypothetical protein
MYADESAFGLSLFPSYSCRFRRRLIWVKQAAGRIRREPRRSGAPS